MEIDDPKEPVLAVPKRSALFINLSSFSLTCVRTDGCVDAGNCLFSSTTDSVSIRSHSTREYQNYRNSSVSSNHTFRAFEIESGVEK
jgi:hypothetical protein